MTCASRANSGPRRRLPAIVAVLATLFVASSLIAFPGTARATAVYAQPAVLMDLATTSAGGSGTYTPLAPFAIVEDQLDDFAPSPSPVTLVFRAPAGFEFEPGRGYVFAVFGQDITQAGIVVTAQAVTLTLTIPSMDRIDLVLLAGLRVRPNGTEQAIGHVYRPVDGGGTASLSGMVATADPAGIGGTAIISLVAQGEAPPPAATPTPAPTPAPDGGDA